MSPRGTIQRAYLEQRHRAHIDRLPGTDRLLYIAYLAERVDNVPVDLAFYVFTFGLILHDQHAMAGWLHHWPRLYGLGTVLIDIGIVGTVAGFAARYLLRKRLDRVQAGVDLNLDSGLDDVITRQVQVEQFVRRAPRRPPWQQPGTPDVPPPDSPFWRNEHGGGR